jgi:hypothetical protein
LAYVDDDVNDVGGEDDEAAVVESEVLVEQTVSGMMGGAHGKRWQETSKREGVMGADGDTVTILLYAQHCTCNTSEASVGQHDCC